jgi:hypothetical protein
MNTLELRLTTPPDLETGVVQVLIDGQDLIACLKGLEAAHAAAEGRPNIAGSYLGLSPEEWVELPEQYGDGRAAILACECGLVGCWPFRVRITSTETTVVWSDFVALSLRLDVSATRPIHPSAASNTRPRSPRSMQLPSDGRLEPAVIG